ncbi:hypothetical protein AWC29_12555 [Mycobacterium triplex]|uniref:Uncharacterized protein n=1 Tax=Mycobacterium triplex TaxID=47839 RepID=A0A024K194_9MYCO|nr:hypothetical protein [Mycobacterium triplex]ORX04739.1 hypothetical protein AWC29_12555 [Mycobacterium triplex]CDO89357.1 hypothetical protein BN973_03732 [Mycobacterium triplex]
MAEAIATGARRHLRPGVDAAAAYRTVQRRAAQAVRRPHTRARYPRGAGRIRFSHSGSGIRGGRQLTTPTTGTIQLGDPAKSPGAITVQLSDFEALRAFGGRRSRRQLSDLPWVGDAGSLLSIFHTAAVRPPADDLPE